MDGGKKFNENWPYLGNGERYGCGIYVYVLLYIKTANTLLNVV